MTQKTPAMRRDAQQESFPVATDSVLLTDAVALVALLDAGDRLHEAARQAISPDTVLLSTGAAVTEAMYLLGQVGGWKFQQTLCALQKAGLLRVHSPSPDVVATEATRICLLMERYQDLPCDFADATLVAAAESLSLRRVFTFDRHFFVYRLRDGAALEVVPGF